MDFERTLRQVKRTFPELDDDEARDVAREWIADEAEAREQQDDTPSIEDRIPDEVLRLRRWG